MSLATMAKNLERFTITKSPAILTAIAVTGTVTTAVLAGKASFKAANLINEEQGDRAYDTEVGLTPEAKPLTTKEKVELTWMLYIPAVSTGATTIAAMITANQIGNRRTAAMAAAYSLSEKAFGEYRDKVVEKLGENKEAKVREELAQDRVRKNPPSSEVVIATGQVLCFDQHSGRYFQSDMESLKKGRNDLNFKLLREGYVSLNDFYDKIGLPCLEHGEDVGWTTDTEVDIHIFSVLSDDQRPCIAFEFMTPPLPGYYKRR